MLYILNMIDLAKENPIYVILAGLALILMVILFFLVRAQNQAVQRMNINEFNIDNSDNEELIDEISNDINEVEQEESKEQIEIKEEVKEETQNNDSFDIEDVTKTLESIPRERTVKLTEYEIEQEENAIISYDELVTQAIPKLDISKKKQDEVVPVEDKNKDNFDYEEAFLDNLKNLNKSLN